VGTVGDGFAAAGWGGDTTAGAVTTGAAAGTGVGIPGTGVGARKALFMACCKSNCQLKRQEKENNLDEYNDEMCGIQRVDFTCACSLAFAPLDVIAL